MQIVELLKNILLCLFQAQTLKFNKKMKKVQLYLYVLGILLKHFL